MGTKSVKEEKLKELFELTFGKEAKNDKDLMYLYSECLKYAVEEITNKTVISDSEIDKEASRLDQLAVDNGKESTYSHGSFIAGAKFYRSELSTTVTEPKKD